MVIDFIKTKSRDEAIAVLSKHLESGSPRYASMRSVDGEYSVGILEIQMPDLSIKLVEGKREEVSDEQDWPLQS